MKKSLCVWDSCAARVEGPRGKRAKERERERERERENEREMQLQFVPLTVRGKNRYCLPGEKRIEPL